MIDSLKTGSTIDVLNMEECKFWSAQVMSLRDCWIERIRKSHIFWTLGKATYLDGSEAHAASKKENAILDNHFRPLLDKISEALSKELGMPAKTYPDYAYPGFHIYRGDERFPMGVAFGGSIHLDKPHLQANFRFKFDKVISYTLPISLPKNGAGLSYWKEMPVDVVSEVDHMSPRAQEWLTRNIQHKWYEHGKMLLHDGETYHQISNLVKTNMDDWRITLQGHGVQRDDHWVLYF